MTIKSMPQYLVVITTIDDSYQAKHIASKLLESRLCACVNIVPACNSMYIWEGKLTESQESVLIIKTTADKYAMLEEALVNLHSYEVPEIIALEIDRGLPEYLNWLSNSV